MLKQASSTGSRMALTGIMGSVTESYGLVPAQSIRRWNEKEGHRARLTGTEARNKLVRTSPITLSFILMDFPPQSRV
jgi:hypothetical protein